MYWDSYFENLLEIEVKFALKIFRMTPNIDILESIFKESLVSWRCSNLADLMQWHNITQHNLVFISSHHREFSSSQNLCPIPRTDNPWNWASLSLSKHPMNTSRSTFRLITQHLRYTSPPPLLLHHHFPPFVSFSTSSEASALSEPNTGNLSNSHEKPTVAQFVISKFSYVWEKKAGGFYAGEPMKSVVFAGMDLAPEVLRRFLRANELKPEDFLEIILGFGDDVGLRGVMYLWKLFRWCELQRGEFRHLPRSYEIMVSVLTGARMLDEAKFVLSSVVKSKIVLSDGGNLFSGIIQAYAEAFKVNDSLALYDQARDLGLVLSGSCYQSLLKSLIKIPNSELVVRVYRDMINAGLASYSEKCVMDHAVVWLAKRGKLLQSVKLVRVLKNFWIEPSQEAISAIAEGFCMCKDFRNMMKFLGDQAVVPKPEICNKIVNSLCANLGSRKAWAYVQRMEEMGFKPDAATFGNLIWHSCRGGNVRDALLYLSECYSRKIMPRVYFYNSIIGGVFKKQMYMPVKYVYDDMLEKGLKPDLYTVRILVAGYCKYRKLDEVQKVVDEVNNSDIISCQSGGCYFSKAMSILGLGHLGVKLKRDNSIGFQKAEFFDNLGNGLYLSMDVDEFQSSLDEVLDLAMVPNLDLVVVNELKRGNVRNALETRDEAVQLGKDLSLEAYEELLRCLFSDVQYCKDSVRILDEMPELIDILDPGILNVAVQILSKNKMADKAYLILGRLIFNEKQVEKESYSSLLFGFCKDGDVGGFKKSWDLAKRGKWSPGKKELEVLFGFLLNFGAITETLDLLDSIERFYPMSSADAYKVLVKLLSSIGYTNFACAVVEASLNSGLFMDNLSLLYLIKGFIQERKSSEALGLFAVWLQRGCNLDLGTFNLVSPLVQKLGCADGTFCLIQPTEDLLPASILELCLRGKVKEANSIFQAMSWKIFHLDETYFNALLEGNCRENNFKNALEILCYMLKNGACISIPGYRALISQLCATQNFEKALKLSSIVQGKNKPNETIYKNILISRLFRMRSESLVDRVLTEMRYRGIHHDNVTYDFLIYGYYKCGNMAKSVEAFNSSISKGFQPSNRSLRMVISHFCEMGSLDKALELYNLTSFDRCKCGSSIVSTLGLRLISSGRFLEAEHLCKKAPEHMQLDPLIRHFCIKGEVKTAISLANRMVKGGNIPCETSYSGIIHLLCCCNEIDAALSFLTEMELRQLRLSKKSSETLIRALCAIGRSHDAKWVLEVMVQVGTVPSYEIYNLLLEKHHEVKNLEIAAEITREMQKAGHKPKFEMQWSIISDLCNSGDKSGREYKPILPRVLSSSGKAQLKKSQG